MPDLSGLTVVSLVLAASFWALGPWQYRNWRAFHQLGAPEWREPREHADQWRGHLRVTRLAGVCWAAVGLGAMLLGSGHLLVRLGLFVGLACSLLGRLRYPAPGLSPDARSRAA
jgi:hypothetical protein